MAIDRADSKASRLVTRHHTRCSAAEEMEFRTIFTARTVDLFPLSLDVRRGLPLLFPTRRSLAIMHVSLAALTLAFASSLVHAAEPFVLFSPPVLATCTLTWIEWHGGVAPFTLSASPLPASTAYEERAAQASFSRFPLARTAQRLLSAMPFQT